MPNRHFMNLANRWEKKNEKPALVSLIEPSTLDAILKRKSFELDLMNYVIIIDRAVRCWHFVIRFEEQNFNLLLSPQLPAAAAVAVAVNEISRQSSA